MEDLIAQLSSFDLGIAGKAVIAARSSQIERELSGS